MWWMPLVGAGVGLLQAKMQNDAIERQRAQQSKINAYAPLFNMQPQALPANSAAGNALGGALGGALSGYSQMQNTQMHDAIKKFFGGGGDAAPAIVSPGPQLETPGAAPAGPIDFYSYMRG